MTARQIIPPTTYGVTVAQAKQQSRILNDAEDTLVEFYLAAAVAYVERTTGRAFELQTWESVLDAFPSNEIQLLPGPVVSVTSVSYIDSNGDVQIVDANSYEVDVYSNEGWVLTSAVWPSAMATINAISIIYVIGGNGMPPDVKQAVLLIAAHWYANREAVGPALHEVPLGAETILSLHRRYYV